jgi:hypothetical protein
MAKKISYNVRLLPSRVAIGLTLRKQTPRKTKLPRYIAAMKKSSIAWTIMITHVLVPLTRFIRQNKSMLNKKESSRIGSFDFTCSLRPAALILTRKALGAASRLSRLMKKVRQIRNQLAHNLNLMDRTKKTYLGYAKVWSKLLTLIGEETAKRKMLSAVKKLNKRKKRQPTPFNVTTAD